MYNFFEYKICLLMQACKSHIIPEVFHCIQSYTHSLNGAMRHSIQVHNFTGCEIIASVNPY